MLAAWLPKLSDESYKFKLYIILYNYAMTNEVTVLDYTRRILVYQQALWIVLSDYLMRAVCRY